ncbi:MAG: mRNA surveillance protein pelota [Methanocellales archaeon]|nr:mRNA surveillance protein pelota [Methanocellales archaeon]
MRVIKRRLKRREGEISLIPESLDDLWHLKYVIEPGDLVFALTKRRVEAPKDKIRPEKVEKKPMRLGISVMETEFHKFSNRLRVRGTIEQGIDLGSYHTINVEPNTKISIIKSWRNDQLKRINEAVRASTHPRVVIVAIEEGEASIGIVRQYGVEESATIRCSSGKGEGGLRNEFFGEVTHQLEFAAKDAQMIIAGPGFTKEDFLVFLKQNKPELAEKAVLESTSSIGISSFQEVLRRGAVDRMVKEAHITKEAKLMESLLEGIAKDGKAAYGMDEVRRAFNYGAIETLLIADETLREAREKEDIDQFLMNVESAKGKIVVFSTEFEPGQRLRSLGGIAALLRFKIE